MSSLVEERQETIVLLITRLNTTLM